MPVYQAQDMPLPPACCRSIREARSPSPQAAHMMTVLLGRAPAPSPFLGAARSTPSRYQQAPALTQYRARGPGCSPGVPAWAAWTGSVTRELEEVSWRSVTLARPVNTGTSTMTPACNAPVARISEELTLPCQGTRSR